MWSSAGSAYISSSSRSIAATSSARVGLARSLGHHRVVRRRSSAGNTTAPRPCRCRTDSGAARCARRSRRRGRRAAPGSRSVPSTMTARSQVRWLRPTWSSWTWPGLDAQQPGEQPLEPDGHVAQADRAVAGVQQRAGHDADRVGEVDDPGVRARPAAGPARRCPARPAPCAAPWPARPRRWSPGRRSRTPAARSRPAAGRPGRRPAAGAGRRRPRRCPSSRSVVQLTRPGGRTRA